MISRFKQPNDFGDSADAGGDLRAPADFSVEELALARDLCNMFLLEPERFSGRCLQTFAPEDDDIHALPDLPQRVTQSVLQRLQLPSRAGPLPGWGLRNFPAPGHAHMN